MPLAKRSKNLLLNTLRLGIDFYLSSRIIVIFQLNMSLFHKEKSPSEADLTWQPDDLYRLHQDGVDGVEGFGNRGREAHVYVDGNGEIVPASKAKRPDTVRGDTFKGGPEHAHPGEDHRLHHLQERSKDPRYAATQRGLRKATDDFHEARRNSRDR